jgi:hypothetical protein
LPSRWCSYALTLRLSWSRNEAQFCRQGFHHLEVCKLHVILLVIPASAKHTHSQNLGRTRCNVLGRQIRGRQEAGTRLQSLGNCMVPASSLRRCWHSFLQSSKLSWLLSPLHKKLSNKGKLNCAMTTAQQKITPNARKACCAMQVIVYK